MKNVGILTLHIGDNYGALLQCYALRHCINKFPECEATIINYDSGRKFPVYDTADVQRQYEYKCKKFDFFNRECNGISGKSFTEVDHPEMKGYDYYITGSDQVWNTSFSFVKETYFLDFVPETAKRIAYAASIGISTQSPKLKREWFERNLPKFSAISIREASNKDFVQQFTDKEVYSVVDPTILLDREEYDSLCEGTKYPDGEYMVLYFLKHDDSFPLIIEYANMLSRKYGLKVMYSFADIPKRVFKNESETFYYSDPKEFVALIKHAKFVITNSFHGTVFSLKYHVPFYTYLVGSMSSRVTDMLTEVGLEDRIVYGYKSLENDAMELSFEKADQVLGDKIKESVCFLKKALEVK